MVVVVMMVTGSCVGRPVKCKGSIDSKLLMLSLVQCVSLSYHCSYNSAISDLNYITLNS